MKKTITLYNYEVSKIMENLMKPQSIMNTDDPEKKLPISVLWAIDENVEKLQNIASRIQNKREEIEMQYIDDEHSSIVTLESGESVRQVKKEYFTEYNKQMSELMSIKNDIDISCVDVSVLEGYSLIPADYRSIRFMLNKEENDDENEEVEKIENVEVVEN